jgi:hypothetical protein
MLRHVAIALMTGAVLVSIVACASRANASNIHNIGDTVTVTGVNDNPIQVTLNGVYWASTSDKPNQCPCPEPTAGAIAITLGAPQAPDSLSAIMSGAGFYDYQNGHLFSEDDATDVPWIGCDNQDDDSFTVQPGEPQAVIVDLETPATGGLFTYLDANGAQTQWQLPTTTTGSGFEDASKYDTDDC